MPASYTAHVNYKGVKHYLGCFPTKRSRANAMREFRASLPDQECVCGIKFRPLLHAQSLGWTFCPEHRKWATWMRYRYKVDNDLIAALIVLREDGCSVCDEKDNLNFDHCHATGRARGWLCRSCNIALGMVEDNVDRLAAMILYLKGA